MQIITYNEFLPALLGPYAPNLDDFHYDESYDPRIANEFSTVAYRFGHSMLSGNLLLADQQGPFGTKALRDIFFNPGFFETPEHVDYIIGGFLHQLAQEIDNEIVDDVRNFLFSAPNGDDTCLDLASLNIHRGRDHGMLSYNGIREAMGLPRKVSFAEVTSNVELQAKLASVYTDVDAIDGWVGALAEDHLSGASVGELIKALLVYQFTALMAGDPFFYKWDPDLQSEKLNGFWNEDKINLAYIIRQNTSLKNYEGNRMRAFFAV